MAHGEIVVSPLFVARGDAPEVFDLVDKSLDLVADFVKRRKEAAALFAIGFVGNVRADLPIIQCHDKRVRIISLVGKEDRIGWNKVNQLVSTMQIGCVAGREVQPHDIALSIGQDVDFGGQTAA